MAEASAIAGGADWRIAAVCIAILVGIFSVLVLLAGKASHTAKEEKREKKEQQTQGGGQRRRGALDRMQRDAVRTSAWNSAAAVADAAEQEDEADEDEDEDDGGRAGRRHLQKDHKKQEKRVQQQQIQEARRQQEGTKVDRHSKYSERQQEKEAERQRQEEEEKKERAEKDRQEKDEFNKWKEMFAVEAEGEDEASTRDESAVERFIEYVKVRKVINLEDLAAEFRMRTSAAIDRLEQLEKLGRISGIFDDRGKFVYITLEEMKSVAEWLKQKGRVGRQDLVASCNRIVRLNPTEEDKAKLRKEAETAASELDGDIEEDEGDAAG